MDKQIIIDGIDVGGCKNYNEANSKDCETLYICAKNPNCDYKQLKRAENQIVELNKMVEAKEQECEELKNRVAELSLFQLYKIQRDEAEKTLTEIKEIAEKNLNVHTCAFKGCGYDLITKQILQKISEVEDE